MILYDRLPIWRVSFFARSGDYVLTVIIALGGTVPEQEGVEESWGERRALAGGIASGVQALRLVAGYIRIEVGLWPQLASLQTYAVSEKGTAMRDRR